MKGTHQERRKIYKPKLFTLGLGLVLGGFIRLEPVLSADFPLKDGGLFFTFINAILQNQFSLPQTIAYNGLVIPFAYPPLSFYISAFISSLLNISSTQLIRVLPALFSILTIPAFYLLASTILKSDRQVCFSVVSFALLPTAVDFMIVGGGLPRSLGYLFAILALHQAWLLFTRHNRRHLIWLILWVSFTFLSHPVAAKFLIFSLVVIALFKGYDRKSLINLSGVALGTILLTSPWWLLVVSRHEITPFINAMQADPHLWTSYLTALLFMQTNEPYLHIQGFLALMGLIACLNKKQYFLPTWLAAVFIFEPRLISSYAILPTALLVAAGLDFLVSSLNSITPVNQNITTTTDNIFPKIQAFHLAPKVMLGFFLSYGLISAYIAAPRQYLSMENRQAMAWIKNNLPAESKFLVISGINGAGEDYVSEWFPALTGSISIGTPQGMEWLYNKRFTSLWKNHEQLETCLRKDIYSLDKWGKDNNINYSYIYIINTQDPNVETSLLKNLTHNSDYTMVFTNHEVIIFLKN